MLLVDDRTGSEHLLTPLRDLGLPTELSRLNYGDICFEGRGAKGAVLIGIELKRLNDLISSIRSGRFTGPRQDGQPGQLHGLTAEYDYAWLVVEGLWRTDAQGRLVASRGSRGWFPVPGKMTTSEMEKHVLTYELCGGVHTRFTNRTDDTVQFIANLYRWFTDKQMDQHQSHLAVPHATSFLPLSPFRQAVMAWPGVGRGASLAAERAFGSVRNASLAGVDEWAALTMTDSKGKSRRFGIPAAEKLVRWLRGE